MSKIKISELISKSLENTLLNKSNSISRFIQKMDQEEFTLNRSPIKLLDAAVRNVDNTYSQQYFLPSSKNESEDEIKNIIKKYMSQKNALMLYNRNDRTSVIITNYISGSSKTSIKEDSIVFFEETLGVLHDDDLLKNSLYVQPVSEFISDAQFYYREPQSVSDFMDPNFDLVSGKVYDHETLATKHLGLELPPLRMWASVPDIGDNTQPIAPQRIKLASQDNKFRGITEKSPLVIASLGNMTDAILDGLADLDKKGVHIISVARGQGDDKKHQERNEKDNRTRQKYSGASVYSADNLNKNLDASFLLLGMKPQMFSGAVEYYQPLFKKNSTCVAISILAGKTIANIRTGLGNEQARVARVMPNLCSAIGEGVSSVCFSDNVTEAQKETVKAILKSVGMAVEVTENEMDFMTALAGSGPSVVFALLRAYIEGTKSAYSQQKIQSLKPEQLEKIVLQVFYGALKQAIAENANLTQLMQNVCSKGGTTVEIIAEILGNISLNDLNDDKEGHKTLDMAKTHYASLVETALEAGVRRGGELAAGAPQKNPDDPKVAGWKN